MLTPGRSILAVPLNDTPPIFLAVSSAVAVSALPVKLVAVNVPLIDTLLNEDDPVLAVTLPVSPPENVFAVTVPEKYPALQLFVELPISLVVPDGTMSESTSAAMVNVSKVLEPISVLPLTVKLPLVAMLPVEPPTEKLTPPPAPTDKSA